jgi:hypothetical protein
VLSIALAASAAGTSHIRLESAFLCAFQEHFLPAGSRRFNCFLIRLSNLFHVASI